jgi:hypothetical protein
MEKLALCGFLGIYLELAEAAKSAHWDSAEIKLIRRQTLSTALNMGRYGVCLRLRSNLVEIGRFEYDREDGSKQL